MTGTKKDLVKYRIARAKDTLEDAQILADREKWNSTINRLYYAAYYAVIALLLNSDLKPGTHNGVKSNFSEHFIKTGIIKKEYGKMYSQLFTWRQKGDYDDSFDFLKNRAG
ncbi:MAG: HEPN domain-containing protein [Bacteroidota bacterium]